MIPFLDIKATHAPLREEMLAAIAEVIDSGAFILAKNVTGFEKEFGEFCRAANVVAVGSGTDALVLALKALGVGPGDEVIIPCWTFAATAAAVCHTGARPVFVDCLPDSNMLDFGQVAAKIGPLTRAVIPVHLYGEMADIEELESFAPADVAIIEDTAQAAGAVRKGKSAGTVGDAGCYSFYPTKNLGSCGEGGLVITREFEIAQKVRHLRNQADDTSIGGLKYHHSAVGFNSRLQEIQAAILRIKLRRLRDWIARNQELAKLYCELLADAPVKLPPLPDDGSHVYSLFTIRSERREELATWLRAKGIACGTYYPIPLHLQPAYAFLGHKAGDFPVAEENAKTVLSLPIYPTLTETQVAEVAAAVIEFFRSQ
jgi:dTDP-4-amino-4,6-dideoxygalactose transaminase